MYFSTLLVGLMFNISPLHLINLKRVAYGVRDVAASPAVNTGTAAAAAAGGRAAIEEIVDRWLGARTTAPQPAPAAPAAPASREKGIKTCWVRLRRGCSCRCARQL